MPTGSVLDRIRIASPCTASWKDMKGDDRVRFCEGCRKNVYNLSALSRDEAERLVQSREGKLCARALSVMWMRGLRSTSANENWRIYGRHVEMVL